MTNADQPFPISHPVAVDRLPRRGSDIRVRPSPEDLAALASMLDLPAIRALEGAFHVSGDGRRASVKGQVRGRVTQICGVTLEPFEAQVTEEVESRFRRRRKTRAQPGGRGAARDRSAGRDCQRAHRSGPGHGRIPGAGARPVSTQARRGLRGACTDRAGTLTLRGTCRPAQAGRGGLRRFPPVLSACRVFALAVRLAGAYLWGELKQAESETAARNPGHDGPRTDFRRLHLPPFPTTSPATSHPKRAMARRSLPPQVRSRGVTAVLGPTNTGKTHLAIERMLAHSSGMIGLPLRLLAREVYQRVVDRVGPDAVALVTGEEKIKPRKPR